VLAAVGAYTLWGLVPLYWPLLEPASPLEILAHRVVWTLVFVVGLLFATRGWGQVGAALAQPRTRGLLALAAVLVTTNWGVFIWAVTNGQVLQSSLGYFINPLVSVLLGVLVLGERLRPPQWAAVALGAAGVVVVTIGYGGLPWVSLALALSFGLYGLVKKRADVEAVPSLAIETGFAAPVAAGYLVVLAATGTGTSGSQGLGHALLLVGAGVVTAVPLLLFGAAAIRIPLSTLGILQYIGPILQFVLALTVFDDPMDATRWAGFLLVWVALAVFTADALRQAAKVRAQLAEPPLL
jgi:chloramphenicol-sensitive protein RarD